MYKFSSENLKGKDQLGDRHRLENYVKIYNKEIRYGVQTGCIYMVQNRDQWSGSINTKVNINVP
jgi:hypothetical protein